MATNNGENPASSEGPRIFVDPSSYYFSNIGDSAMLEIAMRRLRSLWPGAQLLVHSLDPPRLARMDASAEPLDPYGSHGWNADVFLLGRLRLPSRKVERVSATCRALRRKHPRLMRVVAGAALAVYRHDPRLTNRYLQAIRNADLVVLTGAGNLNDSFKQHAMARLETLELAIESSAATALLGQGIGPMSDPVLRGRAAAILPRVDLISLRDGAGSLALLQSMGVEKSRIKVTGDDAVPLGYEARQLSFGSAIGVNIRRATYSGVSGDVAERIGSVVRHAVANIGAPPLALPISRFADNDDALTIRLLLGMDATYTGLGRHPTTPAELLTILPKCRIVVTGSYHAAVLALAMGIPAVTVAGSDYYIHKFQGLADLFGAACHVVLTSDSNFDERLLAAIETAWNTAEAVRSELLEAACRQSGLGEAAYRNVYSFVEGRRIVERPSLLGSRASHNRSW